MLSEADPCLQFGIHYTSLSWDTAITYPAEMKPVILRERERDRHGEAGRQRLDSLEISLTVSFILHGVEAAPDICPLQPTLGPHSPELSSVIIG